MFCSTIGGGPLRSMALLPACRWGANCQGSVPEDRPKGAIAGLVLPERLRADPEVDLTMKMEDRVDRSRDDRDRVRVATDEGRDRLESAYAEVQREHAVDSVGQVYVLLHALARETRAIVHDRSELGGQRQRARATNTEAIREGCERNRVDDCRHGSVGVDVVQGEAPAERQRRRARQAAAERLVQSRVVYTLVTDSRHGGRQRRTAAGGADLLRACPGGEAVAARELVDDGGARARPILLGKIGLRSGIDAAAPQVSAGERDPQATAHALRERRVRARATELEGLVGGSGLKNGGLLGPPGHGRCLVEETGFELPEGSRLDHREGGEAVVPGGYCAGEVVDFWLKSLLEVRQDEARRVA